MKVVAKSFFCCTDCLVPCSLIGTQLYCSRIPSGYSVAWSAVYLGLPWRVKRCAVVKRCDVVQMSRSAVTTRKNLAIVRTDAPSHTCIYCATRRHFFRKSLRFDGLGILVINLGATNVPLDYMQWIGDWALLMTFDSWSTHCILSERHWKVCHFQKAKGCLGWRCSMLPLVSRHDHETMGAKTLETKAQQRHCCLHGLRWCTLR